MSVRQAVLTEILARLAAITVANGYQTDAGQEIFIGELPTLGPDDAAAVIAVLVRDDAVEDVGGFAGDDIVTTLPIDIQPLAKADLDQAWLTIEAIIADVRQAIESGDRTLGDLLTKKLERGRVRPFPRASGSTMVGAAVEYRATFNEPWGSASAS